MLEYENILILDCLKLFNFVYAAGNSVLRLNAEYCDNVSNNELSEEEKKTKEIFETEQVAKLIQHSFKTLDISTLETDHELCEYLARISDIISNIHCSERCKLTVDMLHIKKCINEIDVIMDRRYGTSWECNKLCNLHYRS